MAENPCWDKSTHQHGQHLDMMIIILSCVWIRMTRIWWLIDGKKILAETSQPTSMVNIFIILIILIKSLLRRVNQMMIIRMSRIWWVTRWQKNTCWDKSTNQHGQHFNIMIIRRSRIWWIYRCRKIAWCAEQAVLPFRLCRICLDKSFCVKI